MKTPRQPRTSTADIETLIAAQLRNLGIFLGGQKRKSSFLEGMMFAMFSLDRGIKSGSAAGLSRNQPQRKAARA